MAMTKDVTVEELGDHLVEHVKKVRAGTTLRVLLGGEFVAEMRPPAESFDDLLARPPLRPMRDIDLPPLITKRDILEYLDEERGDR
jgi:antitoxin (DNA-binding transcriptional repressor) of toxin-antitoxin stability system